MLERLVFATVREQRAARRWRIFWRFAWLGAFLATFWWLGRDSATAAMSGPHTAVVEITGAIASDANANAEFIIAAMRSALEDQGSRALVLMIDSPGGSPVQAGMINDEIRRLKAQHQKPIYAVVGETCASAAYYIAVAADEIYVDKASLVGSIGVLMDGFGFTGTMEKLGVQRRLLTAGADKGMLDPFSPENPEHIAHAQQMLDEIHQQFITVVKDGRGSRLPADADVFTGKFWTGQDAIKLGLADKLGSLDQVARDVVKAEDIIDYSPSENMAERLAKKLGAGMGESMAHTLGLQPSLR